LQVIDRPSRSSPNGLPYRRQLAEALLRRLVREELERLVVAQGDAARPELNQGCPSSPSPGCADSDMRGATAARRERDATG
jgi:hypothetical protein